MHRKPKYNASEKRSQISGSIHHIEYIFNKTVKVQYTTWLIFVFITLRSNKMEINNFALFSLNVSIKWLKTQCETLNKKQEDKMR